MSECCSIESSYGHNAYVTHDSAVIVSSFENGVDDGRRVGVTFGYVSILAQCPDIYHDDVTNVSIVVWSPMIVNTSSLVAAGTNALRLLWTSNMKRASNAGLDPLASKANA